MQYERITDSPRSTDCCLKAVERVLVDVRILLAMLLNRIQRIQQTKVLTECLPLVWCGLPPFEITRLLVRSNHVSSFTVNAKQSIV
jgi:hypothetical protein